jgi:hypothetical protein
MVALQLERDCLDEGVLLEVGLDLGPDRLDELEEVLGLELLIVDEQKVREDVIVAFVQLIEIQPVTPMRGEMASQNTS